jgi:hypothetical protein
MILKGLVGTLDFTMLLCSEIYGPTMYGEVLYFYHSHIALCPKIYHFVNILLCVLLFSIEVALSF